MTMGKKGKVFFYEKGYLTRDHRELWKWKMMPTKFSSERIKKYKTIMRLECILKLFLE